MQYGRTERMMNKAFTNRRSKGCFDYSTKAYRLGNFKYDTCIGNYAKPIDFYIEAFTLFEKGIMPFKGTIAEQPNKIIEVFNIFATRRNEVIEENTPKTRK